MTETERNEIKWMKALYPAGCRVVLDVMEGSHTAIPKGTQGVCRGVDDMGSVLVNWDCGSSVNVVPEVDRCHRVMTDEEFKESVEWFAKKDAKGRRMICPRCGRMATERNKLGTVSRRAEVRICDDCGEKEAFEDAGLVKRERLKDWTVARGW